MELRLIKEEFYKILKKIKNYVKAYKKVVLLDFDENRIKSVKATISQLLTYEGNLGLNFKNKIMWNQDIHKIKYNCEIISLFSNEPLSIFPDLNLWLLNGNQAVGLCAIKANKIIWSAEDEERGSLCGKVLYTDVKVIIIKLCLDQTISDELLGFAGH